MDIKSIYTGLPVRATKDKNIYEIIRIDEVTESVFCNQIGTQDADIKEFTVEELKEI